MKRAMILVWLASMATGLPGCESPAADLELKGMCENLIKLRGDWDLPTEAELLAKVEEDFAASHKRLVDWRQRDLDGWDKELEAKLKEAADDEAKAALQADYAKKKEVTAQQFEPDLAKLGPDKERAIEEAKKKAVDLVKARDAEVEKCVTDSRAEGVTVRVAECRRNAKTVDKYWNFCL